MSVSIEKKKASSTMPLAMRNPMKISQHPALALALCQSDRGVLSQPTQRNLV